MSCKLKWHKYIVLQLLDKYMQDFKRFCSILHNICIFMMLALDTFVMVCFQNKAYIPLCEFGVDIYTAFSLTLQCKPAPLLVSVWEVPLQASLEASCLQLLWLVLLQELCCTGTNAETPPDLGEYRYTHY